MKDKFQLTPISFAFIAAFGVVVPAGAADTASSTGNSTGPALSAGQSNVIGKTADRYNVFAGSRSNVDNLATGLRQGSDVTLTRTNADGVITSTTFTPPTKPMGHGNVDKAMALSSQQLANAGVAQPTPEQIKTSMMGGTITNDAGQSVELQGVLQMRADGMGWGKIAQEVGVKPGQGYRPAHTESGVTSASGASTNVSSTRSNSSRTHSASPDKQPKSSGVTTKQSGIVTASGSGASNVTGQGKGVGHRTQHLSSAGGKHSGVINASGHGHGAIHSAGGSVSSAHRSNNGGGGGMGKGHLK